MSEETGQNQSHLAGAHRERMWDYLTDGDPE